MALVGLGPIGIEVAKALSGRSNIELLGAADPAICSLRKIGLAYENMADSVANAPMLRSLPPEAQAAGGER